EGGIRGMEFVRVIDAVGRMHERVHDDVAFIGLAAKNEVLGVREANLRLEMAIDAVAGFIDADEIVLHLHAVYGGCFPETDVYRQRIVIKDIPLAPRTHNHGLDMGINTDGLP